MRTLQTNMRWLQSQTNQSLISYENQIRTGQKSGSSSSEKDETLTSSQRQNLKVRQRQLLESKSAMQTLSADGKKAYQGTSLQNAFSNSKLYQSQLEASRTKTKDTALEVKKLRYDFKGISSQIIRSKTSSAARQAVSKAKREVARLKNLKGKEGYDEEELQAAITHAKAMERVAKKKVSHLVQEEMVKVASGSSLQIGAEESEDVKTSPELDEGEKDTEASFEQDARKNSFGESYGQKEETWQESIALENRDQSGILADSNLMQDLMQDTFGDMMENLMDEFSESMEDMLSELGLDELLEGDTFGMEKMSPEDQKMLKIKHRAKEAKEMAKADRDYLKVIFEQLQKQRSGQATSNGQSASTETGQITASNSQTGVGAMNMLTGVSANAGVSVGFDVIV